MLNQREVFQMALERIQKIKDQQSKSRSTQEFTNSTLKHNLQSCENEPKQSERQYECNKCKDENGTLQKVNGIDTWVLCECLPRKRINRIFKMSEITEQFRKLTFENFDVTNKDAQIVRAFQIAMLYQVDFENIKKQRHNSISLLGQSGCGKTHLLCAISNALMHNGVELIYFPYVEGCNNLKSNFEETENKIERLKKIGMLFIDDLFKGREKPTAWQIETMFAIINYRYMNHLPILISSEKTFDDLKLIDEALQSRILQMSKDFNVTIRGKNLNHRLEGISG